MTIRTLFVGIPLSILLSACAEPPPAQPPASTEAAKSAPAQTPAQRGAYLVTAGVCDDCHSPKNFTPAGPEPDMTRRLSGHPASEKVAPIPANLFAPDKWGAVGNNHFTAWGGPWGVSF